MKLFAYMDGHLSSSDAIILCIKTTIICCSISLILCKVSNCFSINTCDFMKQVQSLQKVHILQYICYKFVKLPKNNKSFKTNIGIFVMKFVAVNIIIMNNNRQLLIEVKYQEFLRQRFVLSAEAEHLYLYRTQNKPLPCKQDASYCRNYLYFPALGI